MGGVTTEAAKGTCGEERPRRRPKPQPGGPLARPPPPESAASLGGRASLIKVTSVARGQASQSAGTVAQPQGQTAGFPPPPAPYLWVHRGHGSELHAEHALVAVHPAHAWQRHLQEGHARGHWPTCPARMAPPAPPIATGVQQSRGVGGVAQPGANPRGMQTGGSTMGVP